jgi:hypothetical protein
MRPLPCAFVAPLYPGSDILLGHTHMKLQRRRDEGSASLLRRLLDPLCTPPPPLLLGWWKKHPRFPGPDQCQSYVVMTHYPIPPRLQ